MYYSCNIPKIPAWMKSELKKNQRTTFWNASAHFWNASRQFFIYNSLKVLLFCFVCLDCFKQQLYDEAITFCRYCLCAYEEIMLSGWIRVAMVTTDIPNTCTATMFIAPPGAETAAAFRLSLWQLDARHLNVTRFNRSFKIPWAHTPHHQDYI